MMRGREVIAIICATILMGSLCAVSQAEDVGKAVEELKVEMQQEGVSAADIKVVEGPAKEMFRLGVTKRVVKNASTSLLEGGVKGKELGKCLKRMKGLIKDGEEPRDAGSAVSRAVLLARSEGLKGKALAAKVHKAIEKRRQECKALMKQKKALKKQEEKMEKIKCRQEKKASKEIKQSEEQKAAPTEQKAKSKSKSKSAK